MPSLGHKKDAQVTQIVDIGNVAPATRTAPKAGVFDTALLSAM